MLKYRYTDWSTREDIKTNLPIDSIHLLDEFGYPLITTDDAYKEMLKISGNTSSKELKDGSESDILKIIYKEVRNTMKYKTTGTCSQEIDIEIKDGVIDSVQFVGGCNGNLKGICALVKGMKPEDAIARLKGIKCGMKPTSCPDQLAIALESMI